MGLPLFLFYTSVVSFGEALVLLSDGSSSILHQAVHGVHNKDKKKPPAGLLQSPAGVSSYRSSDYGDGR